MAILVNNRRGERSQSASLRDYRLSIIGQGLMAPTQYGRTPSASSSSVARSGMSRELPETVPWTDPIHHPMMGVEMLTHCEDCQLCQQHEDPL